MACYDRLAQSNALRAGQSMRVDANGAGFHAAAASQKKSRVPLSIFSRRKITHRSAAVSGAGLLCWREKTKCFFNFADALAARVVQV
jgi:hypothetical protein